MPSKAYFSDIGPLSFDFVLGFSSSHNSSPKPYSPFFLGKGGFSNYREAFGTFQMRSHVGVSFQLI